MSCFRLLVYSNFQNLLVPFLPSGNLDRRLTILSLSLYTYTSIHIFIISVIFPLFLV